MKTYSFAKKHLAHTRNSISGLAFFLFFILSAVGARAQQKYNVIFINVDDLSIAFQPYGNSFAPTPNIQRLAQRGVLFRNVYTQYSLCSPSRTSAFSGARVKTTQIVNNTDSLRKALGNGFRFLPEYFHDYGYRTECYGKFMCRHDQEVSWDYFISEGGSDNGFADNDADIMEDETGKPSAASGGDRQEPIWYVDTLHRKLSGTDDGKETDDLISALKKPVSKPFFYNLGLQTHNPFTPLLPFWNKTGDNTVSELLPVDSGFVYTNVYGNGSANIPLPVSPPDDTDDIPGIALKYLYNYTPDAVQRLRHAYYSEIIQMDSLVGRVVNEIDAQNLWDSTVIVFWSDHGLSMGEHDGMWLKIDMFEECLRIPMILCAPGIKPGVCDRLVESVDLFQTLTELCNIPAMQNREGSSMVPLLQNPGLPWKKAVFSNLQRNNGDTLLATAVRTDNWHYNNWQEEGEELYDMVNDPYEITNLAANPLYADTLKKMQKLLNGGWQACLPPVYTRRTYYRDADGDGFGKSSDSLSSYSKPDGYAVKKGDCNDQDKNINPGAIEHPCNNMDDNCDNSIDENRPEPVIRADGSLDICETGMVTLSTNFGNGISYQWMLNNVDIPRATYRSYTAKKVGSYTVKIARGDCSNTAPAVNVYSSCLVRDNAAMATAAESSVPAQLSVSPNPSPGVFIVRYTGNSDMNTSMVIYNSAGQVIHKQNIITKAGINTWQIDITTLAAGVYQLVVNGGPCVKLIKN